MILTISPSSLNSLQECPKKYEYSSIKRLRSLTEDTSKRDRGSLFHEILEHHYNLLKAKEDDIILAVTEFARSKYREDEYPFEMVEESVKNYQEYASYYLNDNWNPLAVETPFTKIIFENDHHKIVMEGIIDLIAENQNSNFVVDHKTSEKRDLYPTILSNQFKCYAWATGNYTVIKNDIGFQKTLGPAERFNRHVLSYTNEHIEEWRESVIYFGMRAIDYIENERFPMSESSCFRCSYRKICEATPDSREYKINNLFRVADAYNIYQQ